MKITRKELRRLIVEAVDKAGEWDSIQKSSLVQSVGKSLQQAFDAVMPENEFQFFDNYSDLKGEFLSDAGYHELGSLINIAKNGETGVKAILRQTARKLGLSDDDLKMINPPSRGAWGNPQGLAGISIKLESIK